jgi:hypothetical protein
MARAGFTMRLSFVLGFIAMALAVVFFAASCSDAAVVPGDAMTTSDTASPPTCPSGYTACGNECFALKRDPLNCGACGKACAAGEVCVQGGCALQCAGGATKCANVCVSTKSDPNNCGMCGIKCPPGEVCNNGKCAVSCSVGLTNCSNACVDLQTDDDNCGMCAATCGIGQKCSAGKCVANCQSGWSSCPDGDGGTTCVNLNTDSSNCGVCGTTCPNGQFCSPGADGGQATCGLACFGQTTKCGNKCVDLMIDPQNCGACGVPCNGTCFGGMCCSGNQVWCNGSCRDWKTDQNNCGGCGIVCAGPCNNGVCCGAGEIICSGKCSNLKFDPKNCNGCGNVCPMNAPVCANGVCVQSTCGNNQIDMGERCDGNICSICGSQVSCINSGLPFECKWNFAQVPQLYCNGGCSWAGNSDCDQADADIYCQLVKGNPSAKATSFSVVTALGVGGFPCAPLGYGTQLGTIPEYGVNINVAYQSTSILADHGAGNVITNVTCQ